MRWLQRGGQSIRLPPLPRFPNQQAVPAEQVNQVSVEAHDEPNDQHGDSFEPPELPELLQHELLIAVTAEQANQVAVEAHDEPIEQHGDLFEPPELPESLQHELVKVVPAEQVNQVAVEAHDEPIEPPELLLHALVAKPSELSMQPAASISRKRRFSTAGGILFSVNEIITETGSDFMEKLVVPSSIIAQPTIENQFDPFQRIANPPFALRGRKRAASQDGYFGTFSTKLATILE